MALPSPAVVVVTGASSGVGRATALAAAQEGHHLVLVARDAGTLEDTAAECTGAASTTVVPTDLGSDEEVSACFERVLASHGRVDAVLNCGGVVAYGRAEEVPAEVFEGVLRTNLLGSVNVARHAVRTFRRQRAGVLVLVGSVVGHIAVPQMTAYVVSKHGVRAMARQLQVENRDLAHLHVAYAAPGGVDTPIYVQAANYAGHVGRPPPPVASPERVGRQLVARLDRPRRRAQLSLANHVLRFGFTALPRVYDALVGPLFTLAATDLTSRVAPHPGNVLAAVPGGNRLSGDHGSALLGIGRNLAARLRP